MAGDTRLSGVIPTMIIAIGKLYEVGTGAVPEYPMQKVQFFHEGKSKRHAVIEFRPVDRQLS